MRKRSVEKRAFNRQARVLLSEEVELIEEPSIEDTFERTLAKLRPEITKSEEYKMLSGFISEITS